MIGGEGQMELAYTHPIRAKVGCARAQRPARSRAYWKAAGLAAVLTSGAALASLPTAPAFASDDQSQWRALAIAPLSSGGSTGIRMAPGAAVESIDVAPTRMSPFALPTPNEQAAPAASARPLRIRGRVGDGLYWSLRAAGASPEASAQYLAAIATQIDVGDVGPSAGFDLVIGGGADHPLLYAGLDRSADHDLQLVRWSQNGRSDWVDAANSDQPAPVSSGMILPVIGHITSYFGNRIHPILRFVRFHAGLDIGAGWGSPIVAAGDGQVVRAGWAGGYGRQVMLAHGGGLASSYSHMSQMIVSPGSFVRRGQLIGYVGSSGLSTGPHLHFEVRRGGTPVNPLSVRIESAAVVDPHTASAIKARLAALLKVGTRRS